MIFGFNTDVKHGDTVYHVQSEANSASQQLLTTVFVQGRCLGKKSSSYAEQAAQPDCNDQKIHEILKEQYRRVRDAIREGHVEQVIATPAV